MPQTIISLIIISLKFVVPTLLLFYPFFAAWGNYFLDVVDGDLLQQLGLNDFTYQTVDKTADLYSYVFMLLLGIRWKIKKIIVVLFVYRLVGQLLFFATRNELAFVYFQNFLEPLVMIYTLLIFRAKSEAKAYKIYQKHIVLIWFIILAYKLWNEWYLHFANIDLSTFFLGWNGSSGS